MTDAFKKIGEFGSKSVGDFVLSVYDLAGWSTGTCLIKQVGQGQTHEIVVNKDEAIQLADILYAFGKKVSRDRTAQGTYTTVVDDDDDVFTVEEFREDVRHGAFNDDDGFGYPVKDGFMDKTITIKPSCVSYIPKDATHVVWYNK